jgi:hypothetical protein
MDIKWRTIQFFISANGVCEVQSDDTSTKKLRCTCRDFALLARCKHIKFVKERIGETGIFTVKLAEDTDSENIIAAMDNPDLFREFLIHHAKIEVLE